MKNKKKMIANIILLISILIFLIIMLVSFGDIKSVYNTLINADYKYILIILGLMAIYFIIWPLSLSVIIKKEYPDIRYISAYEISSSEFFFNGITPFSSGGQPFQAYALSKKGVKLSQSTSILMINFIIYQVVINVISIIAISLYFNTIKESTSNFIWIAFVGFTINFLVLILLILISVSKKTGILIHKFLAFLSKAKLFKKLENVIPSFDQYVSDVQIAFKTMVKQKKTIFVSTILKVISLLIFYAIPFYGLKALHLEISYNQLFYVISMTCFALTMVVWLPTPGSSGGAEYAFSLIFAAFSLSSSNTLSLMLIWRFATYYLVMIFGFIMYLIFERSMKKNENRNIF